MLEIMAAMMAMEGYGALSEPTAALAKWRDARFNWRPEEREWWLNKARAALRGLEFAGVAVVP